MVPVLLLFCLVPLCTTFTAGLSTCTNVPPSQRLSCQPDGKPTRQKCLQRGCCWNRSGHTGAPYCFFSNDYVGYNVSFLHRSGPKISLRLTRVTASGFSKDIKNVLVVVSEVSETLVRVKITDEHNDRFVPSIPELNVNPKSARKVLYDVQLKNSRELHIYRLSTKKLIFKTDLSRLIFADQFLQLSTSLPSNYVYGLGEHKTPFRKRTNWDVYTFWNRDTKPLPGISLYGSHPFHFTFEDVNGHASGIFLFNLNAMDIQLSPAPAITYRTTGGILDLYVFVHQSPEELVREYIRLIGVPAMPPLWALGFHLSRYGWDTLNETVKVWNRTRNAMVPLESMWNDIEYMKDNNDFTYDTKTFAGLPQFVKQLHSIGMRYIPILDPGIAGGEPAGTHLPYEEGIKMNVFLKNASNGILIGNVWNHAGKTVYPDFSHPNATKYWTKMVQELHSKIEFDGLWLDMNEPANFADGAIDGCPASDIENPPYVPGGRPLRTKTVCASAKHYAGLHYNLHNLYGTMEAYTTNLALHRVRPGKRPFILSRSTSPGQGMWAAHWNGDIVSTWDYMQWSIPAMLEFNMFGIPLFGSDICGFFESTTVELCARWSSLGAFYPFSRNHNGKDNIDQDPAAMGPVVLNATKFALNLRYQLLPHLYTLFYRAHKYAETVARPLFFVYPKDARARSIEAQFMWGDALMIVPVLEQKATSVNGYLPKGRWYFVDSLKSIISRGENVTFNTPLGYINVLLRGGKTVPMADGDLRLTKDLHDVPFKLIVALNESGESFGELYWDDGESLDALKANVHNLMQFVSSKNTLRIVQVVDGYKVPKRLSTVVVVGVDKKPVKVVVNKSPAQFSYDEQRHVLQVFPNERLHLFQPGTISWN